jgi:hypothetical protein
MTSFVENSTLPDEGSFSSLKQRFERRRAPMDELWGMVMPETSNVLSGFGGKAETITKLRKSLSQSRFKGALNEVHLSRVGDALDQTLNPPTPLNPPIPQEWRLSSKARSKRPAKESEGETSRAGRYSVISLSY